MRLRKLAVLCNGCFWLTLLFQLGLPARNLQQDLLNTIVMLGLIAVLVNLVWIVKTAILKLKPARTVEPAETPVNSNIEKRNNQTSILLFNWFSLLSFAAQLIFLYFKFL